jgi:hypothetical protein
VFLYSISPLGVASLSCLQGRDAVCRTIDIHPMELATSMIRVLHISDRSEVSRSLVSVRYPLPRRLADLGSRHNVALASRLR